MRCPLCKSTNYVETDLHSEEFSEGVYECSNCHGIWTAVNGSLKVIKGRVEKRQKICTEFVCPTCKFMVSYETDLDSFQFHEELYECSICGTISSVVHDKVEVVKDSQKGSFLESAGDPVESNDYDLLS